MSVLALLGGTYSSDSSSSGAAAGVAVVIYLIYLALAVLAVVGLWKIFVKAGQKGWYALIPILNWYVIIKLVGREGWWLILLFIPCVNFVVLVILSIDLAKAFGKELGYGLGLAFLSFIFYPLLGFSDAQYRGPQTTPVL